MRLSWNEIRARAAEFSREWADAHYERGDTHTFYNEFFEIFGVKRRKVASFEEPVKKLGDKQGFIDLFWKGVLLVEQKSAGRNLEPAKTQALDYFPGLKDHDLPRYILLSDFQNFELYDLDEDREVKFKLHELHEYVQEFGFVIGVQRRTFRDQAQVNIDASYLMGELHDALEESGYTGHDLERYLVRLLFCLFADDTGIFEPRDIMLDLIEQRTSEDGSDTGQWLNSLFEVLNTPEDRRLKTLDEDLAQFPYVNGDLFSERLPTPSFDSRMRQLLINACNFHWEAISPAIFGALFQSVMDKAERRKSGGHYTSEQNIMKVIGPLFMDDLWTEFEALRQRKRDRAKLLTKFHEKLAAMRFLDPACGCGNFLIITYREMRLLEMEVLRELRGDGQLDLDAAALSKVDVHQFYGIELFEFPSRIAEAALWMMDHIMNNRLSLEFGEVFARIPLVKSPRIVNADALEADWSDVLDPSECTVVLGNPPFIGSKFQSNGQRSQVRSIAQLGGSGGTMDYVCAWFIKAGSYVRRNPACRIGFVATNSITQGEQVAQLWPILFNRLQLEIDYAHRTFCWASDARGRAHVHVVILGLSHRSNERTEKRLFSYDDINGDPDETQHTEISAYLFGAETVNNRHLVVEERSQPLCDVPRLIIGSKPIDGGNYIFTEEERTEFLKSEPGAVALLRPFFGANDYISGKRRWILALHDASPNLLIDLPSVRQRISNVREYRAASSSRPTQKLAETPTIYHVNVLPESPYIIIPRHSSERRDYIPIGFASPPIIPGDSALVLLDADVLTFGILTSRMHMSWLKYIGGRIKSDPRYSAGLVYNTFPWPDASDNLKDRIRTLAQAVLDARATHVGSTLADLYDPDAMPPNLRRAHRALDAAVDALYKRGGFSDDRERVEHLFGRYEKLMGALPMAEPKKRRRGRVRPVHRV